MAPHGTSRQRGRVVSSRLPKDISSESFTEGVKDSELSALALSLIGSGMLSLNLLRRSINIFSAETAAAPVASSPERCIAANYMDGARRSASRFQRIPTCSRHQVPPINPANCVFQWRCLTVHSRSVCSSLTVTNALVICIHAWRRHSPRTLCRAILRWTSPSGPHASLLVGGMRRRRLEDQVKLLSRRSAMTLLMPLRPQPLRQAHRSRLYHGNSSC
jgi:hypothetical protein